MNFNAVLSHQTSRCLLTMFVLSLASMLWSQERTPTPPTIAVPTTFAGISVNSTTNNYPPSGMNFGLLRIWDTPSTQWPAIQSTKTSGYTFTHLDTVLGDACTNSPGAGSGKCGSAVVMYSFGQVPSWASGSTDTGCAYAAGTCEPPSDINPNGSGADSYWSSFIVALANHLTGLSSTQYAPVKYFEVWNEIDRSNTLTNNRCQNTSNCSYNGTDAQLLRMNEDMRCILLGKTYQATIHGTGSACSYNTGLMPGVQIVAPSVHAQGSGSATSTGVIQNFFYCSDSSLPQPDCNWGSSHSQTNWGALSIDIVNFHMKPGNETGSFTSTGWTDPEVEMQTEYNNATAVLQSTEKWPDKALWNGESGYSGAAPCGWTPNGGDVDLNSEPGQQAAFLGRYFLTMWSLNIQNNNWYQYDNSNFLEGYCSSGTYHSNGVTTDAYTAYNTVFTWMVGNTMSSTGCAASTTFTDPAGTKTLYSCTFTNSSWTGEVFWDSNPAYACTGTTTLCPTTYNYTVGSTFKGYQTVVGTLTPLTSPYQIAISNMPTIVVTGPIPGAR